jgi:hypothetical protein
MVAIFCCLIVKFSKFGQSIYLGKELFFNFLRSFTKIRDKNTICLYRVAGWLARRSWLSRQKLSAAGGLRK